MRNQVIALAGTMEFVFALNNYANHPSPRKSHIDTAFNALFSTHPVSTLDVFVSQEMIKTGVELLHEYFNQGSTTPEIQHCFFKALHCADLLYKQKNTRAILKQDLSVAKQIYLSHAKHEHVLEAVSKAYLKCMKQLPVKCLIHGNNLKDISKEKLFELRLLFLAAIRSAFLFKQLGGYSMQLIFKRKQCFSAICGLSPQLNY